MVMKIFFFLQEKPKVYVSYTEQDENDETVEGQDQTKKRKRKGRKCTWPEKTVDDLIDIILNNEVNKKKLILTNVKSVKNAKYYDMVITELKERYQSRGVSFDFTVNQTPQKLRRCVGMCRNAALKIKTASGIKRFQEDKDFGMWFPHLLAVVQLMDNCQPEQAIEPGISDDNDDVNNNEEVQAGSSKLFVPNHESSRKSKKA